MVKDAQALTLPEPSVRRIGTFLLGEAFKYDQLRPFEIGTHTSYLIHDDPGRWEWRWISIHYRRNLRQLGRIDSWLRRGVAFLRALEIDLHLLAKALEEDPQLRDVRMIIGLSSVSASWGRKHGFTTLPYTDNDEVISRHNSSITDNPNKEKGRLIPLTLFFFRSHGFIKEFHKEELSCV
ncbi:hypothetical protein ACFL06_01005 [Patescibacteria group bacterium]